MFSSKLKSKPYSNKVIYQIFQTLYNFYGPQRWWPAETKLEVIIGAILTQNTSWQNVERAILNLKNCGLIDINKLSNIHNSDLAKLIRPSGFFNIKTKRLKAIVKFLKDNYSGKLSIAKKQTLKVLRQELLNVYGIGKETADSILLYGLDKPIFVVDKYTKRVLTRHRLIADNSDYDKIQQLFMSNLPKNHQRIKIYKEYHALLVQLSKDFCRAKPLCEKCPIKHL